jgi:hypothetical protein
VKQVYIRFGPTILLTLADPVLRPLRVFLPRRYADVVSDAVVEDINLAKVGFNLIYRRQYRETKSFKVEIE